MSNNYDTPDALPTDPGDDEPPFNPTSEQFRALVEGVKDYAIFFLDINGNIRSWNAGAERLKGYTASDIIGRHFSIFYPPEKIAEKWPEQELVMARADGRFEDEGWRIRKDGSRFWANVVITAHYLPDGTLFGFSKITRDLTDRMLHEESLRESEERFRLLVEGVKDYAIFMLDPDGYIVSWNAGAERLKGYTASDIIGRHFSIFYPPEKIAEKWPEQELVMARADGRFEDEGWRIRKDGSRFWANVVITTLYDRHGIHRGFSKITRDMTERKRVEALELAERRMTEFLAILSHELRNPLAPIRNAVSIMQMMDLEDEHLRWAVDVIDRQATHMTRLVEDLLEVSRVTNNSIKLKHERFDLRDVAARAIESSQPLIDARDHTLSLSLPEEPLPVEGDLTRITQVALNLLNNAAKYTPEGGLITLTIEENEGSAVIRVRDNGIGITADFLPRMFDLFVQGGRSLDRSEGGLGIGLTLVQRLVGMHGGTVSASSEGPGQGSEFVVRLPLAANIERHGGNGRKAHRSSEPADIRVLVVDDNPDIATTMAKLLSILGYQVQSVTDSSEALALVPEFRPDIVLLDIGLPTITGYDVARQIRMMPEAASTTLIAITGYGQEEDRRRIREAGFSHHLVKPVDSHVLRALLASLAKERQTDGSRRDTQ